jgi:hypothetical protein
MNFEIFASVLTALIVFRLLAPSVDRLAGWLCGNAVQANKAHSGSATAGSNGTPKP